MTSRGGTLATLNGMKQYFIINVLREFFGDKVLVLINEGSTHNFVNEKLAIAKRMRIKPFSRFDVMAGNGNITPCKKYIPKMKVILKYYTIDDDFFIFPLGDSHVVLGVQWLVFLGDYTTNHSTSQFKFKSGDHEITLQEIKEGNN